MTLLSRVGGGSTRIILASVVVLSFGARVLLTARLQGPWIFPDELGYEQVAANLARGHLALYGQHGLSYSPSIHCCWRRCTRRASPPPTRTRGSKRSTQR